MLLKRKVVYKDGQCLLPLSRPGIFALISPEDIEFVEGYNWALSSGRYAATDKVGYLHRAIKQRLGVTFGPGDVVDHVNRNTLDNRRNNLRVVTQVENAENSKLVDNARGVFYEVAAARWKAYIGHKRRTVFLGSFKEEASALEARRLAQTLKDPTFTMEEFTMVLRANGLTSGSRQ